MPYRLRVWREMLEAMGFRQISSDGKIATFEGNNGEGQMYLTYDSPTMLVTGIKLGKPKELTSTANLCADCGGGFGAYTAPEARCTCA